jgi:tetratricopeptide (TPR) repeat protein
MSPASLLILFLAFQSNFYDLGIKALDEMRYPDAVANFTKAVANDPKDYTAYFNLALAYSLQGNDADAVPQYKKTLELKPDLYQANLNLSISLLRLKRDSEALPYLTSAVAEKPKEYRPNYYLGAALLGTGDYAKAQQCFATALEIDPKSPDAELGLAHALQKQNHLADAAPHFQKAAELNPAYRRDLLELGSLYEAQNQPNDAIAIYQQFPDDAGAQERLGALLIAAGRPADAIAPLQTAVAKSPTPANQAALASAYVQSNQAGKALSVVDQILAATPNDFDIRMLHGRIVRDQRKFPEAAQDFRLATALKPDDPHAWSELAVSLVMAEDYSAALNALDKLAALHAEKPGHVYLRAIILDKINDRKGALASYQRFLSLSNGQSPDEEFKARQRAKLLERELRK